MIKNSLRIYRKNIWNVFAIIGFVSLGIFIALFVILPIITNSINITLNKIVSEATKYSLRTNDFINSLNKSFGALDWANPIKTLKELFENNLLVTYIRKALADGGLGQTEVNSVINAINSDLKAFGSTTINQIYVFVSIVAVTSIIGYISTKIVIQINSTNDRNILRFIASFILNILALVLVFVLLLLSILSIENPAALFFSALGIFILMLICMLIISIICYKKKGIGIFEILNLKNTLYLFLSSLIIFSISFVIFAVVYIFSDIIALLILIPLLIITTIIIENIVVSDVTTNLYKKLETSKK